MNKPTDLIKALEQDWTQHPAIEWINAHKKWILSLLFALFTLVILAYRFITVQSLNTEKDFYRAEMLFSQLKEKKNDQELRTGFEQLHAIIKKYDELKPKYEGELAQMLLISGEVPQAHALAHDIFQRTQTDQLKFYQQYSQISLLIGERHFPEAIQLSENLKNSLDQVDLKSHPLLYTLNLIRLAILYQETGLQNNERMAWEELQNKPELQTSFFTADQFFKSGQVSLKKYIEERKKRLI